MTDSRKRIQLKTDSTLPLLKRNGDALLASNFRLGIDDDLLRYQATYSLEPGDIVATGQPHNASPASPTRFARQNFGQNVKLGLAQLGGGPLSLGLATEFSNSWMVSGFTQAQRERADLNWSPGPATVSVQWAGTAPASDATVALACDLQSTVRLRTHEGTNHSEGVTLTSRDCVVAAGDTPYAGIEAQSWGVGYVWTRPTRQSEALVSVIDPVWTQGIEYQDLEPGYELGLSHRRDFGSLSARTLVSLRQAPAWDSAAIDAVGHYVSATNLNWATNASLTWNLPKASLSANWETGVDRMWFTPDIGQRLDRFGLALNLSRWIENLMPFSSPNFAMNWKWSQMQLPVDQHTGNNALSLDVALMF
ncbi:MAG: hypothetical protein WD795_09250 [Woeseia sp.]